MKTLRWIPILLIITLAACSDDDPNSNNPFIPVDMGTNNQTNNTNNQPDGGGEDGGDTDMPVDPDKGCEQIEVLDIATLQSPLSKDLIEITDSVHTSCDGEEDWTGSYVYRIEVDVLTKFDFTLAGVPKFIDGEFVIPPQPTLEIRKGTCAVDPTIELCSVEPATSFVADPDEVYYIVINGRLESDGFNLQVETEEQICRVGEAVCKDGKFDQCLGGVFVQPYACISECVDASTCNANTCEDAVVAAPLVGGDPVTLLGHRHAYSSTWSAEGRTGCSTDGNPGPATDEMEFFVKVPNVLTGQTLVIDAEDAGGSYYFFLLDSCSASTCLGVGAFDGNDLNRMEYTAEADGDLFIAVEAVGASPQDFDVKISLK